MSRSRMMALLLGTLMCASTATAAEPTPLEAAYQKEFAFLSAEKKALEARLDTLVSGREGVVGAAERELGSLEAQTIAVGLKGERLDDSLDTLDREVDGAEEASEALVGTLLAARTTLDRQGFAVGEETQEFGEQVAQLRVALAEGLVRLDEGRTVRRTEGSFFLSDGVETTGQLAYVGNVGVYGVSEAGAGALVPAGQGHLRLWTEPSEDVARAVVGGTVPAVLPLYVFENMEKRVEPPAEKTLATWIENGGVVGLVIMGLLVAGVLLVVGRAVSLVRLGRGADALLERVAQRVEEGDLLGARKLAEASGSALGTALARVVPHVGAGREHIENVVTEALLAEQPRIERFGTPIMVIAAVAPLLGLLGTVTGMIGTFDVITQFGTGDPKMLSGGISEALVTTQMGLVVAIPMLLLGNLLGSRATALLDQVERGTMHVVNVAEDHRSGPELLPSAAK
ncbi:MAG: MotA/TolQ/ExbB proton channel family protein [Proteobacteria bacterium]|nr:MotA/TolQ/ExbB proton channel family protein [Pseudomonadota bacterium]